MNDEWADRFNALDDKVATARAVARSARVAFEAFQLERNNWHRFEDLAELIRLTERMLDETRALSAESAEMPNPED